MVARRRSAGPRRGNRSSTLRARAIPRTSRDRPAGPEPMHCRHCDAWHGRETAPTVPSSKRCREPNLAAPCRCPCRSPVRCPKRCHRSRRKTTGYAARPPFTPQGKNSTVLHARRSDLVSSRDPFTTARIAHLCSFGKGFVTGAAALRTAAGPLSRPRHKVLPKRPAPLAGGEAQPVRAVALAGTRRSARVRRGKAADTGAR
jgi:hypothetical protein